MHNSALLSNEQLTAYLARVGFKRSVTADLDTLNRLHAAQLDAIAFENIDVLLGQSLSLDPDAIFNKLVMRQHGGCCYELNGLFGRVLSTIGFKVTRMAACVMRDIRGNESMGTHLCLRVSLDQDYLADTGFSGSMRHPLPLEVGSRNQQPFETSLARTSDGLWRYTELSRGGVPFPYDFTTDQADEALLAEKCTLQTTMPDSVFVQNLVLRKRSGNTHLSLRGRVLVTTTASGTAKSVISSASELVDVLDNQFKLNRPEIAGIWNSICARHEELFGAANG